LFRGTYSWGKWPGYAAIWFFVAIFYNTCHLVSWDWHFPIKLEAILWHLCTIYTAGNIVALGIMAGMFALYDVIHDWKKIPRPLLHGVDNFIRHIIRLVSVFLLIGTPLWLLARLFMILEAYISLRNLKKGSFSTVQWSQAMPHLG
jgi:hypothetical protein